ncbi:uncharacterized protein [Centruroides vittatus]|uniref:uncharacterized protein n=1 Tax=Centruroides vittatus TaxID=120091 RepID=UPI0035104E99
MPTNSNKLAECCGLTAGGIVTSVYTTVIYMAAFAMELWWIIEQEVSLPAPAYILAAGYFFTFLVSLFLLVGVFLKKPRYVLGWLFVMALFFLPECGLVVYMSVYHWTLEQKNGLLELTFYVCRAFLNVLCIVCVLQLYRRWKEEKTVMRRLENLHVGSALSEMNLTSRKENGDMSNGHINTAFSYGPSRSQSGNFFLSSGHGSSKLMRGPSSASTSKTQYYNRNCGIGPDQRTTPSQHPYWRSDKCEFDASSFNEYVGRSHHTQSDIGVSRRDSLTLEPGKDRCVTSPMTFSTQSLERPKFKKLGIGRRSRSLEEMNGPTLIDDYVLEKINERPFQYLERPGSMMLYEDSSPDHSIGDIAL